MREITFSFSFMHGLIQFHHLFSLSFYLFKFNDKEFLVQD